MWYLEVTTKTREIVKTLCLAFVVSLTLQACQTLTATSRTPGFGELTTEAMLHASEFLPHVLMSKIKNYKIDPHWLSHKPSSFWYEARDEDERQVFYLVDGQALEKHPLFDHQKLANEVSSDLDWRKAPLQEVQFEVVEAQERLTFTYKDKRYLCRLDEPLRCKPADDVKEKWPRFGK